MSKEIGGTVLGRRVKMEDIARKLGVSKMTVSLALRDDPSISAQTKKQIQSTASEMGYVPNRMARGLISGKSSTIGIVVGGMLDDYQDQVIRGVVEKAMTHGYTTAIGLVDVEGEEHIIKKFHTMMVDGFISFHDHDIAAYEFLQRNRVPFVLYARYFLNFRCDYVISDNLNGGYQMTQHLIKLGHKRIAFVSRKSRSLSTDVWEREQGYRMALNEAGLSYIKSVNFIGNVLAANGSASVNPDLVDLLSSPQPPTALFACNDITAAGVYGVLREMNMRIPQDVSVAGFEGLLAGRLLDPPLTTVVTPVKDLGMTAAEILIDKIEDRVPYNRFSSTVIPTTLQIRASTSQPVGPAVRLDM